MKLVFNHLPKCGGMSVTEALAGVFGNAVGRYQGHDWDRLRALLDDPDVPAIAAHLPPPVPDDVRAALFAPDTVLITVVRDPVARLQSLYSHYRAAGPANHVCRQGSLSAILDHPELDFYERSSQSEQIALRRGIRRADPVLTTLAHHYAVIAPLENLGSLLQILHEHGLCRDPRPPHSNRSQSHAGRALTAEEAARVRRRCALDTALHRHVLGCGCLTNPPLMERLHRVRLPDAENAARAGGG